MGLDINAARFLLGEKSRGVSFGHTLTLGRQGIYMNRNSYASFLKLLDVQPSTTEYADDFFRGIGANPLTTMDASNYEGAEIIHDMNDLIQTKHHSSFNTIIDGGTLEHVFNFPNAIKNCMKMVKQGGQLILMTPWHNYSGHGFYQFSPELIYNTLSKENGYHIERMLIAAEGNWYSVKNPSELKQRIEICTKEPILLYVTARRVESTEILTRWPQQSDYHAAWQTGTYGIREDEKRMSLKNQLIKIMPFLESLRSYWRGVKYRQLHSVSRNPGFTKICPSGEVPFIKN